VAERSAGPPGPDDGRGLARICGYLIRRSQAVHNQFWSEEVDPELTSPQYAVLAVLAAWPRIDQKRVSELASLDKSSAADVVARLERRHWVQREKDPADARRNLLQLSPAAAIAFQQLTPAARRVQERLLAPVPQSEQADFVAQLTTVARLDPAQARHEGGTPLVLSLDAPGHLIRRAQQWHTSIWAEEFDRELTGPQYAVLFVLSRFPGISQKELGEQAALDKSTAADLVDRLTQRAWITRDRDPADGRRRILTLTPAAQISIRAITPRAAEVQQRLLAPLAEDERADFLRRLAAVAYRGETPPA
jgi:DNA-binding MarR family transcriptional regulator